MENLNSETINISIYSDPVDITISYLDIDVNDYLKKSSQLYFTQFIFNIL